MHRLANFKQKYIYRSTPIMRRRAECLHIEKFAIPNANATLGPDQQRSTLSSIGETYLEMPARPSIAQHTCHIRIQSVVNPAVSLASALQDLELYHQTPPTYHAGTYLRHARHARLAQTLMFLPTTACESGILPFYVYREPYNPSRPSNTLSGSDQTWTTKSQQ